MTLNGSEACSVDVSFTPQSRGHFTTALLVANDGLNKVDASTMEGTGTAPVVVLTPASIGFGHQTVNRTSEEKLAVLANSGNSTLSITSIVASDNFAVTDDCGDSLAAEESCTLNITFTPPTADDFTGTITVTDDASGSPHTIALSGTGVAPGQPDIGLSRSEIDFANQLVNTTSVGQDVTVTNTGTVNLTIDDIVASANFAQTNDCPATLAPAEQCTVSVTFTPTDITSYTGMLLFDDDATDSPQTVTLTGTGTSSGTKQLSLSATSIDFGNVVVESQSDPQTITISNSGEGYVSIEDVDIEGEEKKNFSENDSCHGITLSEGETCTVELIFAPTVGGELTAILGISDDASDSPQTVLLQGTGSHSVSGSGCSITSCDSTQFSLRFTPLMFTLLIITVIRRKRCY